MIQLYHGSTVAVRKPSLRLGRPNADFGKGFYTTSNYEQAVIMIWNRALWQTIRYSPQLTCSRVAC